MSARTKVEDGREALLAEVASARWYHVIDLPHGVSTPGEFDLPAILPRIPLPPSLAGKRCLDVGTRDGFWAFEMERRGAEEVVAIDLDDPTDLDWPHPRPELSGELQEELEQRARTFSIASRALGSRVERRNLSVYDLSPERVGEFDFAFLGTLLLHLRNPIDALAAIRGVLGGELLVNDAIMLFPSLWPGRRRIPTATLLGRGMPFWWTPNAAGLRRQVEAAGFELLETGRPYLLPNGPGRMKPGLQKKEREGSRLRDRLVLRRGMPHAWVRARPLP